LLDIDPSFRVSDETEAVLLKEEVMEELFEDSFDKGSQDFINLINAYGERDDISLVHIAETHAHGNPSGIDMVAESSECPIWFQKGKEPVSLQARVPLHIVVADTGRVGDTHAAVAKVKKRYLLGESKVQKSLNEIEEIANAAREALLQGDIHLLGKLLNRNQEELIALGVSDDGLNLLIETARNAGALGAKLTGGGLGGCMMALAGCLEEAKAISSAE
jgi:mevalonate kinase